MIKPIIIPIVKGVISENAETPVLTNMFVEDGTININGIIELDSPIYLD